MWLALDVIKGLLIWCDQSRARTGFDRHVTNGHATFHRKFANCRATIFDDVALSPAGANLSNDRQDDVFSGDTWLKSSFNIYRHCLWTA